MARGNQRDKAREKNQKESGALVSTVSLPSNLPKGVQLHFKHIIAKY